MVPGRIRLHHFYAIFVGACRLQQARNLRKGKDTVVKARLMWNLFGDS